MTEVTRNLDEDALYWPNGDIIAVCEGVDALREFFLHERDEELGRWRDPDAVRRVAYPLERESPDERRVVRVVDEQLGFHLDVVDRDEWNDQPFHIAEHTARRYFAAHPEPKPWHDAKPGEVWVLTYGGRPTAHVYTDRTAGGYAFVSDRAIVDPTDPDITAGEKIWEEE